MGDEFIHRIQLLQPAVGFAVETLGLRKILFFLGEPDQHMMNVFFLDCREFLLQDPEKTLFIGGENVDLVPMNAGVFEQINDPVLEFGSHFR